MTEQVNLQHTFILPISQKKVEFFDIERADGHMLMKARMFCSEGSSVGFYILSQLCKVDGESVTQQDLMDMDFEDVMRIEMEYSNLKKKLLSPHKK